MVQEELVRARLRLLEGYMSDLRKLTGTTPSEYKENLVLRRYAERTLHLAIEACLDIGYHIISSEGYREPRYGRDVITILAENGWLDSDTAARLQGMAGFRNILVHDYATIELDAVLNIINTRVPDMALFASSIVRRLDDQGTEQGAG